MMQRNSSSRVQTYSVAFYEDEFSEGAYAREVAQYLGTDHTELFVTASDALEVIPKLPQIYDEPLSDTSQIPTYLVAQLASRYVKVCSVGRWRGRDVWGIQPSCLGNATSTVPWWAVARTQAENCYAIGRMAFKAGRARLHSGRENAKTDRCDFLAKRGGDVSQSCFPLEDERSPTESRPYAGYASGSLARPWRPNGKHDVLRCYVVPARRCTSSRPEQQWRPASRPGPPCSIRMSLN